MHALISHSRPSSRTLAVRMLQQIPKLLTWANKKEKRTTNRFADAFIWFT